VGLYFGIRGDGDRRARFTTRWAESGVKVRYTAFTHPEVPAEVYADGDADPYPAFRRSYLAQREFGGEQGLRSGQAMQGHDAVLALGRAIRDAASETGTEHVRPGGVLQMLDQLDQLSGVRGVGGPIAFDDAGNPAGRPMALIEMDPRDEGSYRYIRSVRP
jgi:ABC-type branched-subunit amino acid transport system substrate-binding protein